MSNPIDPRDLLRQRLGQMAAGRVRRKTGSISPEPVTSNTEFVYEEETYWDPQANRFVTHQKSKHWKLKCGCRVSSPNEIRGICPYCALSWWVRLFRIERLICRNHTMCLRCQRTLLRQQKGGGFLRTLITIVLWPLFDVTHDE